MTTGPSRQDPFEMYPAARDPREPVALLLRDLRTRADGLAAMGEATGLVFEAREGYRPFDAHTDYLRYVDGKPRSQGVRGFLTAPGVPADDRAIEDAPAGVTAGRRGGFGLVIGVDRNGQAHALRQRRGRRRHGSSRTDTRRERP
jgi:Predicted phosphatase/phosphohexomutase